MNSGGKPSNLLLMSIRQNKRIINLSGTKYGVIREVAVNEMDYQIGQEIYNLLWTDYPLSVKDIKMQQIGCRVNHIPEITQITRKNKMATNLNHMRLYFAKDYSFYPQTWVLPSDFHKIVKRHTKGKVYICKPQNGCQGQGIYLTDNPNQLDKANNEVVQQYIMNPMLIEGLKFDLRIYVLITSVSPLRIYLYKDGIARFATEKFQKPKGENLNNNFSHLTNYAINKNNKNFTIDQQNCNSGHKRLLCKVFEENQYIQLMQKISAIIIKTIISGLPAMQNAYEQCKKSDPTSCFQLLGFDILLLQKGDPILLQVNQNPSLVTDTYLDKQLKAKLVKNILQMITGGYSSQNDKFESKIKMKDKHQQTYIGDFKRIYPCTSLEQTQYYDDFMAKSMSIYRERFGINVVRYVKKVREKSVAEESMIVWNENPLHYTRQKVEKVYGNRGAKTSQFKKRLIFI